jgi:hypothetical protein
VLVIEERPGSPLTEPIEKIAIPCSVVCCMFVLLSYLPKFDSVLLTALGPLARLWYTEPAFGKGTFSGFPLS